MKISTDRVNLAALAGLLLYACSGVLVVMAALLALSRLGRLG